MGVQSGRWGQLREVHLLDVANEKDSVIWLGWNQETLGASWRRDSADKGLFRRVEEP